MEKSGIKVSLSTLKRIWRDDFSQSPHPATLNALVSIIDYPNWRAFQEAHTNEEIPISPTVNTKSKRVKQFWPYLLAAMVFLAILVISSGSNDLEGQDEPGHSQVFISEKFAFSSNKTVDSGLPNTVIFNYNLEDCEGDSFFIQKSWNPANKIRINPTNQHLSEIYYVPGFHWARLMANDSVVKRMPIHILSDGWMAIARYSSRDRIPMYLDHDDLLQNGTLSISQENFLQSKVDMDRPFRLRYYNVQHFEGIDAQNFALETSMRCESGLNNPCPNMEVMLLTEAGVHYLELTSKGCVSNLGLKFGEKQIDGRNNDLSALGTDVYQWQSIAWVTDNGQVTVRLNDNIVFEDVFEGDFGKIVGVICSFTGPGSIDYFRLKNLAGESVYTDEFGENLYSQAN